MPIHITIWRVLLRNPAAAVNFPPFFTNGEEGNVANTIVVVTLSEDIVSPTDDYATGFTVKFNGASQTINSAARQTNNAVIYLTLAASCDQNDAVTVEYSDASGDLRSQDDSSDLESFTAQTVGNNVGEHWRFDHLENSTQLALLF
jgi:hypothetical protein